MMQEETRYEADRFRVVKVTPEPGTGLPPKELIRHPGAVVIVPWLAPDRLCLIRNLRLTVNETLIEFPAGTRSPDEPHEITAKRELEEETGYRADNWRFLGTMCMSPGILDETMYVYEAHKLELHEQRLEEDERIETLDASLDEILQWVADGTIRDAKTIAALMLCQAKQGPPTQVT